MKSVVRTFLTLDGAIAVAVDERPTVRIVTAHMTGDCHMTTASGTRTTVLHTAEDILARLNQISAGSSQPIAARPRDCVIRPLDPWDAGSGIPPEIGEALWDLTRTATALLAKSPGQDELTEAAAPLQQLAVGNADHPAAEARLTELQPFQARRTGGIQVATDSSYLVTNVTAASPDDSQVARDG